MKINIGDNELDFFFDNKGNAYLKYKDKISQIGVDKDNMPYCEKGEYIINGEYEEKIEQMYEDTYKDESHEEHDEIRSDDGVLDEDYDENVYCSVDDDIYYEEKNHYYSISTKNLSATKFYFCSTGANVDIFKIKDSNILALYDTFVFTNNDCIYRSKLLGEPPLYVLKVYNNGNIGFRDMCSSTDKYYKIIIENDNVNIIKN